MVKPPSFSAIAASAQSAPDNQKNRVPSTPLAWPSDALRDASGKFSKGMDLAILVLSELEADVPQFITVQGSAPILAHVPHAGVHAVGDTNLVMSPDDFQRNALTLSDWLTDDLFAVLYDGDNTPTVMQPTQPSPTTPCGLAGSALINRINRFYFDPERYADREKESMEKVGMGVFYRHGCDNEVLRPPMSDTVYDVLLDSYYHPYHNTLAQLAENIYAAHDEIMVVDCHSFPAKCLPYEGEKTDPRPEVCLGVNDPEKSKALIQFWERVCAQAGFSFGVNTPFAGALIPETVSGRPKVLGFMLEINRSTYLADGRYITEGYASLKAFLAKSLRSCFLARASLCNSA